MGSMMREIPLAVWESCICLHFDCFSVAADPDKGTQIVAHDSNYWDPLNHVCKFLSHWLCTVLGGGGVSSGRVAVAYAMTM